MKLGVRILAIACAPTQKKKTLLAGVISRNDYIEGIVSTTVTVDGTDSARRLAQLVSKTRFSDQIRLLVTNGLGVAGLNILDITKFEKLTKTKVISITRRKPRPSELIKALKAFSKMEKTNVDERLKLAERLKKINCFSADGFYLQTAMEKSEATKFAKHAFELVRLAHLIARGISTGESKGRI